MFPSLQPGKILTKPLETLLELESRSQQTEISIVLCDDPFIHVLNKQHRGYDKPTDVLSFPQDDPEVLGDIVISLETAARQAESAGWPFENEVILLAVHGLLHLLGYDDETVEEAAIMRDKSLHLLSVCGYSLPDNKVHPFFISYH